jgi:hypothetical protein
VRAPRSSYPSPPAVLTRSLLCTADRELWWRQTSFKANEITTEAQAEGAIEGSGDDYKVADLFSTDFKYSRFAARKAPTRNISALSGVKRVLANAGRAAWKSSMAGAFADNSWEAGRGVAAQARAFPRSRPGS